jgi:putative spermidine/putrescine transport system substrate-binding protein
MQKRQKRTSLGVAATVLMVTLTATACGGGESSSQENSKSLTVVSYGGPYQETQSTAFFKPFSDKTGITVTEDSPTDYSQLRTMVDAGRPTWDLALVANDFGTESDAKYLEPIDYSAINSSDLIDGAAQKYRLAADIEGTVLAYRKDKLQTQPESFADLFDTQKFPGKRMFNKLASGGVLEAALLADGVQPSQLFPLDVDRALAKLDTIKKDIVWWATAAQSQQLLASGEASMGLAWVGRAVDAGKEAPVAISWKDWLQVDAYWVIPKGAPNAGNAQKLLAEISTPAPQTKFASLIGYGPINKTAAADSSVTANENRPTNHLATQIKIDDEWWGKNAETVDQKFQQWLLK